MPERIQLKRSAGWRKPEGAVVVARPHLWGNPWKVGRPGGFWLPAYPISGAIGVDMDAADAVELYRRLFDGPDPLDRHLPSSLSPHGRRQVRNQLRAHAARIRSLLDLLRGRDLACWCPLDQPCHADVLLRLANQG